MQNWGGTHTYQAPAISEPASLDELAAVLRGSDRVRFVGTRHTFTGISDAPTMVGLARLGERFEIDEAAGTVRVDGAMTYSRLGELLAPHGLALHNVASLTDLSIAGAVATATHGSGDEHGCLSTAVAGLELMTSDGDLLVRRRGDSDFDGLVVGLGAAGAVVSLTLDVVPATEVYQHVHLGLGLDELAENVDEVFASGASVSAFTTWADVVEQVWVKQRIGAERPVADVVAAAPISADMVHPVPGLDPAACTDHLGAPGPWSARLPHFRAGEMPNAGHEMQSEYFVGRDSGGAAIRAVRAIGDRLGAVLMVGELRTVRRDGLWLSPFADRDALAFHFTWQPDPGGVLGAVAEIETALGPFDARPHWGKVFTRGFSRAHPTPRRNDAAALFGDLDPRGVFANEWLQAEGLRP